MDETTATITTTGSVAKCDKEPIDQPGIRVQEDNISWDMIIETLIFREKDVSLLSLLPREGDWEKRLEKFDLEKKRNPDYRQERMRTRVLGERVCRASIERQETMATCLKTSNHMQDS